MKLFTTPDGRNHAFTFVLISSLFLLWGFCNGMIDVMDKHFQDLLHLSKSQSAWVQFAHYMGYCFAALPAGWLARKLGYKGGIIAGLFIVALGGFWFIPATFIQTFWAFLLGILILAAGLTFLETVANPYTTVLGPRGYAATRINAAQSCNGVGWILGPLVGGLFFYSDQGAKAAAQTLWIPYACIAVFVLLLAVAFLFAPMPDIAPPDDYHRADTAPGDSKSIWSRPHFVGAVMAQFLYVAAQAGIFAFFINYAVEELPAISQTTAAWLGDRATVKAGTYFLNEQGAAWLLSFGGLTLFLLGRMTGAAILAKFAPHRVLGTYAAVNVALMFVIFVQVGWLSLIALLLSFFFMSIMFPTIFALGIYGLGEKSKLASSFIVMAIMGGAFLPKLMGWIADHSSMAKGFIVPLFCFAGLAIYAFLWQKLSGKESNARVADLAPHSP